MQFQSGKEWRRAPHKRVMLFGMSGLGKTHISNILRASGDWFHYSVDYRIGTRYMGEHIVDNFKAEAMLNPFLANLLRSDSIYIGSNITFENLSPLSTYMGKPGNPALGGIPYATYRHRQEQHRAAEISALLDTPAFVERAGALYGYDHFVCDSGGSICEVVNPDDPDDPIMEALCQVLLPVWIEGDDDHGDALVERFERAPKPMYFDAAFLASTWSEFRSKNNVSESEVNPDDFMRFAYRRCLDHRMPIYGAMAKRWGLTVQARDMAEVHSVDDFNDVITNAIEAI